MTTKDSSHSYIHLHSSRHADLFEDFARGGGGGVLGPGSGPAEGILVPAHLQPPNPEDEDDVVPDQHAAFGIQRATQPRREAAWRDLGLAELVNHPERSEQLSLGTRSGGGGGGDANATTDPTVATASGSQGNTASVVGMGQIVGRPGLGRGAGWSRAGESAVGVGVRNLPR